MEKLVDWLIRHKKVTASLTVFLLTMLFFIPGLGFDPIPLDSNSYVTREYLLYPTWENFIYHLKTPVLDLYSPLVMHSFMLDYALWGKELMLVGGRVHNIFIHALNAVLFFWILLKLRFVRMNPAKPLEFGVAASVMASLCFALHPQRVESVIWVVERKDVMVLFCGLLSILLFMTSYRKDRLPWLGGLVYLLSFGAKPLMLFLPVIILTGIWFSTEKFDWKHSFKMLSPYIAVFFIYFIFNAVQLSDFAGKGLKGAVSCRNLWYVISNYAGYFFQTLFPARIRPLYPEALVSLRNVIFCSVFWGGSIFVFAASLLNWSKRNIFAFFAAPLLFCFLLAVLPMAGFSVIGNVVFADRYSYFPSIFIWIAFAGLYESYSDKNFILKFFFPVYMLFIAVLGFCYLNTWQTRDSFINAALGDGKVVHRVAWRMASWSSLEKGEMELALKFAAMPLQNKRNSTIEDQLFLQAMEGMALICSGDKDRGLELINKVLSVPQWGNFRRGSKGFAENVMLTAANIHLGMNSAEHTAFAANIFMVLGNWSMGNDPAKDLNFRAISAMLTEDYTSAEKYLLEALKYSPGDSNLLNNLKSIREKADAKKFDAKAASNL